MKHPWITATALSAVAAQAGAQTLVRDIETAPPSIEASSSPRDFTALAGQIYFSAETEVTGRELFVTDGTPGTAELQLEFGFGPLGGDPAELTRLGSSAILFVATDATRGRELWRLGVGGAAQVLELEPGPAGFAPRGLRSFASFVAFVDPSLQTVWRTDGSLPGTFPLSSHGAGALDPELMIGLGGQLYYLVEFGSQTQLWTSDGSVSGTLPLVTIPISGASNFVHANGIFYATGFTFAEGNELWRTDGTGVGTFLLKDIEPAFGESSSPVDPIAVGSTLFFSAFTAASGYELWSTDGTTVGTQMVIELEAGAGESAPAPVGALGAELLFSAAVSGLGRELWVTDGTAAGTQLVADLHGGPASSSPERGVLLGSSLIFAADDGASGVELWSSDGSAAGTVQVADLAPGPVGSTPQELTSLGGGVIFSASAGEGTEPYFTGGPPGAEIGTGLLADLAPTAASGSSNPDDFVRLGARLYFTAGADDQLWTSDGSAGGTTLVGDPAALDLGSVSELAVLDDRLWFQATTPASGAELWSTTGTTLELALDLEPGPGSSSPSAPVRLGDRFYFAATRGDVGRELWKSDGTAAGTEVFNLSASAGSDPLDLTPVGPLLFFSADFPGPGREPFVSDGTQAGTISLGNLQPGPGSSITDASEWVGFDGQLYFTAVNDTVGLELWRSDGTPAGTELALDLLPGPGSSGVSNLLVLGSRLLFTASPGTGPELWSTDGTTLDLLPTPGAELVLSGKFSASNDVTALFFTNDGATDTLLWRTDGTPAGTVPAVAIATMVLGVQPIFGDPGSGPELAFRASDGLVGSEVWISNGTAAGTRLVVDVAPGPLGSDPGPFERVGSELYFSADDGSFGRELHAVSILTLDQYVNEPVGGGSTGSGCGSALIGPPTLDGAGRAVLGETFTLEIGNVVPQSAGLLAFSFQASVAELFPDCYWYLGASSFTVAASAGPTGTASLPVVPTPGLLGIPILTQYIGQQIGGPIFEFFGLSDPLEIVVGF